MSKRAWVAWMAWAACHAAMAADASPTAAERAAAASPAEDAEAAEAPHRSGPSQLEVSTGDRSMDLLLKARLGADASAPGEPSATDQAARVPSGGLPVPPRRASAPTGVLTAEREGADPTLVKQLIKSAVGVLGSGERTPPRDPAAGSDPAGGAAVSVAAGPPADGLLAVPGRFFSFIREHRDWVVSLALLVAAGVGVVVWRQGRTARGRHVAPTTPAAHATHAAHRRHGSRRRRRT